MTSSWVPGRVNRGMLWEGQEEGPVRMGSGSLAFESLREEERERKSEN